MRIAHIAIATPGRCGLYETTREIVAGERALGVDARLVDPRPHPTLGITGEDRGVPIAGMDWATTADVLASHSGHDGTPLSETEQPIVHVAHGRPLSTFLGERNGGAAAYSYHYTRSRVARYRACVTFWPEHEPILRPLWAPKPVLVVPAPVDLDYWTPGPTGYDFAGRRGDVNVVMTDPWARVDVSGFYAWHAFALFRSIVPGARLHIYASDGNTKGFAGIARALGSGLGVLQSWARDLRQVYRAADLLITPHRIYTRAIREAMACGVQVVSGQDCAPEDVEAFAIAMARRVEDPRPVRKMAEALFDPMDSARSFHAVAESCVEVPCGD